MVAGDESGLWNKCGRTVNVEARTRLAARTRVAAGSNQVTSILSTPSRMHIKQLKVRPTKSSSLLPFSLAHTLNSNLI